MCSIQPRLNTATDEALVPLSTLSALPQPRLSSSSPVWVHVHYRYSGGQLTLLVHRHIRPLQLRSLILLCSMKPAQGTKEQQQQQLIKGQQFSTANMRDQFSQQGGHMCTAV